MLEEEEEELAARPWVALRSAGPRAVLGAATKAVQPAAATAATASCWVDGAMAVLICGESRWSALQRALEP